jgi:hypothetical protein
MSQAKWLNSEQIDKNDLAQLRVTRSAQGGGAPAHEMAQVCPFFFTRNGVPLSLTELHCDATAFLIAAGPSFAAVDKRKLRAVWTMTLNNAVASYRGNASCIVDDPSRFSCSMWLDPMIQKFVPMSALAKTLWDNRLLTRGVHVGQQWRESDLRVADCPNVIGYIRNEKFDARRYLREDTINWGCHAKFGGGRSVMLAALRILYLLGFRRVYLLGVDFEMTPEKRYHFSEDRPRRAIRANMTTYALLQRRFAELQPYFLEEKFIVKNCNPDSKLTSFPYISFDAALAEATAALGDYTQERTTGMYKPLKDKVALIQRSSLASQ